MYKVKYRFTGRQYVHLKKVLLAVIILPLPFLTGFQWQKCGSYFNFLFMFHEQCFFAELEAQNLLKCTHEHLTVAEKLWTYSLIWYPRGLQYSMITYCYVLHQNHNHCLQSGYRVQHRPFVLWAHTFPVQWGVIAGNLVVFTIGLKC